MTSEGQRGLTSSTARADRASENARKLVDATHGTKMEVAKSMVTVELTN